MSGTGALIKDGLGTLTLGGANSYTGGTQVNQGAIFGTTSSLQGTIINNALLNISVASDGLFNGTIAGSGSTIKTGTGSLSLLGTQATSGIFTISEGTLILNGLFGGSVNVSAGAALRATGSILGSVNLAGSLFVVPPASAAAAAVPLGLTSADALTTPPILTIAGNLNTLPGSTISLPVGAGANPSILVGGTATLNGTRFDFLAPDIGNARSTSFIALTALQGLVMSNVEAATQNRNLVPYLKQNANSLFVTLLNLGIPLSGAVTNPNSISAAQSVDRVKAGATEDLGFVVRELTALTDDELNDAMQQVAAEVHSSSLQLAVYDSQAFTDLVRRQITERDHESQAGVPGWGGERIRWWGQFGGERGRFDDRGGARGGLLNMGSGASGMDWRASERWLIGAGGGFGAGHMGINGLNAGTDFKAPRAFGYVGYKPKGFGLRAGGSAARASTQTERRLAFAASLPAELGASLLTGGIDRLAEAEETEVLSDQWSEYADDLDVQTYTIDWTLGVRRARFGRGGFTETGAGALSLISDGDVLNLTQTDVKLHVWRRKGNIRPYVEGTYRRELTKGALLTTLRFAAAPNSDFEVKGLPVPGDTFAGRAGVTLMTRVGAMTFEYQMQRAAGQLRQSADFRVRFK